MSKQGISRRNHFSIEGIQKGYLFREKGKGLDNGTELPRTSPPPLPGNCNSEFHASYEACS